MSAVTIDDIRAAAAVIGDSVATTACSYSRTLSQITGAELYLKFENQQFTGSFKDRGALVKLLSLSSTERRNGVIAMSAGNHAQAVAWHAQRLNLPATIVMPRFTPNVKVEQTRGFGAEVILFGQDLDEARSHAETLGQERGLTFIHPYDDAAVVAGQGTVGLEMLEQCPDLEMLVVPVGGGGLVSGIATAAKSIAPSIEIFGVQTTRYPAMRQVLRGESVRCGTSTIAEGIAVKRPGALTTEIVRALVSEILLVDEPDIEAAVLLLLEVEKTIVEGAGAAALAAVCLEPRRFAGKRVGIVLSGGNLDLMALAQIIERGLVRSNRLVRIAVAIPDLPGGLAEVTRLLGKHNANIIQVRHQRAFTHLALRSVEAEFVLNTCGGPHVDEILTALRAAGYDARLTSPN